MKPSSGCMKTAYCSEIAGRGVRGAVPAERGARVQAEVSTEQIRDRSLRAANRNRRAAGEIEGFGGAGGVRRELEMIGAAEDRPHTVGRHVRIGRDEPLDAVASRIDLDRASLREPLDDLAVDVRHEIAESIDAHHDAADGVAGYV